MKDLYQVAKAVASRYRGKISGIESLVSEKVYEWVAGYFPIGKYPFLCTGVHMGISSFATCTPRSE